MNWPGPFSAVGRATANGVLLHKASLDDDCHVHLSDDGQRWEMYLVASRPGVNTPTNRPAHISYSECPITGDLTNDWSNNQENGEAIPYIRAVAGTETELGVDTPYQIIDENKGARGVRYVIFEARPGDRDQRQPALGTTGGRASVIFASWDSARRPSGLNRTLCVKHGNNNILLRASQPWQAPFKATNERMEGGASHWLEAIPNYTSECDWRCRGREICSLMDTGGGWQEMADEYYTATPVTLTSKED